MRRVTKAHVRELCLSFEGTVGRVRGQVHLDGFDERMVERNDDSGSVIGVLW